MYSILRRVGFVLVAVIAGIGGGYLAINSIKISPPQVVQSQSKQAIPAQPFPGQKISAIPAIPAAPSKNQDCGIIPYHKTVGAITSVSGITADISLYPSDITAFVRSISGNGTDTANRIEIRTLFKTRDGILFAAGSDYLWGEFRYFPTIYRSTDQGKTWATVYMPANSDQYSKFVEKFAEDANGVLWAVGMPGVLKSADGGMSWSKVNISFVPFPGGDYLTAQTYRDFVRNVLVLKDNSVLITVPFYSPDLWQYAYTNVYRTTDGGATWNLLFTQKQTDIINIVEAQDGALVFTDQDGRIYRFMQGKVTNVFKDHYPQVVTVGALLKTRDNAFYYAFNEQKLPSSGDVVPTIYRSDDNGVTWRRVGNLPSGSVSFYGDVFAEGNDGRLYLATYANCWSGTIYQSSNQGRKWEIVSGNLPGLSSYPSYPIWAIEEVNGKILHAGNFGGVIFTTP